MVEVNGACHTKDMVDSEELRRMKDVRPQELQRCGPVVHTMVTPSYVDSTTGYRQ